MDAIAEAACTINGPNRLQSGRKTKVLQTMREKDFFQNSPENRNQLINKMTDVTCW
jgi:hypothetical protein